MLLFSGVILLITMVLFLFYRHLVKVYDYWKTKNVNGPTPTFPFGNTADLAMHKKSLPEVVNLIYHDYPREKLIGFYIGRTPAILVKDPDFIKHVLIKDFMYFRNHSKPISHSPLNEHLFFARDEKWRFMRQKLTTVFTSGKIKCMFDLMNECMKQFDQYLERLVKNEADQEVRNIVNKIILKLFGSCMVGIDMPTLTDQRDHYTDIANRLLDIDWKISFAISLDSVFPGILRKLNIKLYKQEVNDFFINLIRDLENKQDGKFSTRKNFMDILLQLKEQGHIGDSDEDKQAYSLKITEELLASQVLLFYAGFSGSSGTLAFLIRELALRQDIQEKVYREVRQVTDKYNGVMTYDAMHEMTYLNMVLAEILRKYSNGSGLLFRECTADYTFPGTSVKIDSEIVVIIPMDALHNDPKYFPNPEKFDPERFAPENLDKLQYGTYLPFGEGPRQCIALRFAKLQSMMIVASILMKYQVLPSARTTPRLKFDPKALILESADGIWVKLKIRD